MARESFEQRVPESLGPGQDNISGTVTYGVPSPAGRTFVEPPRSTEEREADRAYRAAHSGCSRCQDVPEDLLLALRQALRAAKEGRLPL